MPDIEIKPELISNLSLNLLNNRLFFDYATKFASKVGSVDKPLNFEVSDKIFEEFKVFSKSKEFEYKSASTVMMKKLKKIMEREKSYDISTKEFDALKDRIQPDLDRDFTRFRAEISSLLGNEIIKRYYNQLGGIEFSIKDDKTVKKAIEVLNNKKYFGRIIDGKEGTHALKKK
jgi:carboxyl-terminal processing protease